MEGEEGRRMVVRGIQGSGTGAVPVGCGQRPSCVGAHDGSIKK